jgi:hypothetical protein
VHSETELHHAEHDRHCDQRPESAGRARREAGAEAERQQMDRVAQQRGIDAARRLARHGDPLTAK